MADTSSDAPSSTSALTRPVYINRYEYFTFITLVVVNGLCALGSPIFATEGCRGTETGANRVFRICQEPWLSFGPCLSSCILALLFVLSAFAWRMPRWVRYLIVGLYIVLNIGAWVVWNIVFATRME